MKSAQPRRTAMTLIEILVGMAIFVTIIMLTGAAFNQFQTVSRRARQAMQIHAKAAKLEHFLSERLGSMLPTAALWYSEPNDHRRLVFLRTDTRASEHSSDIVKDHERNLDLISWEAGDVIPAGSDLAWCIIDWSPDGSVRFGQTPQPTQSQDVDYIGRWGYSYNYYGHRRVTVQDRIAYLVGRSDASEAGEPRIRGGFKRIWSNATNSLGAFKDQDGDGQAADDYIGRWPRVIFDLGMFGNSNSLSGPYAVGNPDGRSWNIDWINLVGDGANEQYYPDQRILAFEEVEFLTIDFLDAAGDPLTVEDDSLGDGNTSLDWYGLATDARLADRQTKGRPALLRVSFLLHAVSPYLRDDDDLDGDGDLDERLVNGARGRIQADTSLSTATARREAMRAILAERAELAETFTWIVELPR